MRKSLVPHFVIGGIVLVVIFSDVFWPSEPEPETPVNSRGRYPLIEQDYFPPQSKKHLKVVEGKTPMTL